MNPVAETEHQQRWWGLQNCRRCNPKSVPPAARPRLSSCADCGGKGWTDWAALANEPWSEIIPGLWVGGHDYVVDNQVLPAYPMDTFDVVVSMYHRLGYEPSPVVTDHYEFLFRDSDLTPELLEKAWEAAQVIADNHEIGAKVLSRCQAGLNRSSLVAGMALYLLGFKGEDAVQLIRAARSPWALVNDAYEKFLLNLD